MCRPMAFPAIPPRALLRCGCAKCNGPCCRRPPQVTAVTSGRTSAWRCRTTRCSPSQWHLLNTGQQVGNPDFQDNLRRGGGRHQRRARLGFGLHRRRRARGGDGFRCAVESPGFAANIHPTLRFNAITGTNNANPSLFDPEGPHGTAVAGLIGAVANNGIGGTGVAPGATLVPVRIFGGLIGRVPMAAAINFATQNGIDITSNSWGPPQPIFDRTIFPMTAAGSGHAARQHPVRSRRLGDRPRVCLRQQRWSRL